MTYCVSDDFVRDRNKGSVNIVKEWIKHSGYDRTRPLRAEIGSASDKGSLKCFTEEGCIPATAENMQVVYRVFDGGHRHAACVELQGR